MYKNRCNEHLGNFGLCRLYPKLSKCNKTTNDTFFNENYSVFGKGPFWREREVLILCCLNITWEKGREGSIFLSSWYPFWKENRSSFFLFLVFLSLPSPCPPLPFLLWLLSKRSVNILSLKGSVWLAVKHFQRKLIFMKNNLQRKTQF